MAAVPATALPSRRDVLPAPLRVARPIDALDLDAALLDALGPHRAAQGLDQRDDPLAAVIPFPGRAASSGGRVRTGRTRVVALLVALVAAIAVGVAGRSAGGDDVPLGVDVHDVVVLEPGQTLWDLAERSTAPGGDVRATLQRIRHLNGFTSTTIPAWTPVVVPAG